MNFISKELDEYCNKFTTNPSKELDRLEHLTHTRILNPRMISGKLQGRLLSLISKIVSPKYILDIGTYTGYSAVCLSEGLEPDGKLVTIEINEELQYFIKDNLSKLKLLKKIIPIFGDATKVIPKLDYLFDIVFIDADKINYSKYFDLTIDKLNPKGLIIADNLLWSGKVIKKINSNDKITIELKKFTEKVNNDPRVENIMLPIRDGILICQKK
jgi:predicted O-methyltransferase YrrM